MKEKRILTDNRQHARNEGVQKRKARGREYVFKGMVVKKT